MTKITVSVIVTTYNRTKLLEQNIQALLNQRLESNVEMEIIIVDDCSQIESQTVTSIISNRSDRIKLILNPVNKGLSGSRNVGAASAKGNFLLFLDDDIIVDSNYVNGHLSVLVTEKGVASVGSLRFPPELTRRNNLMRYLSSRELRQRDLDESILSDLSAQYFGGGICGICKDDFRKLGGFNEMFRFYGGEDVQMGSALKKLGVRLVFASRAKADHFDTVDIDRYRSKYIEAAREGYRDIYDIDSSFFDNSSIRFLLPLKKSSGMTEMILSVAVKMFVNRFTEALVFKFVSVTNRYSSLYNKYLYHFLFASWFRLGFQSKVKLNNSEVNYSND